jgi:hypothetical protein
MSGGWGTTTMSLEEREQDLLRREYATEQHQKDIDLRTKSVAKQGGLEDNFPRPFLCIKPVTHHDISADIPSRYQKLMRIFFGVYLLSACGLVLNAVLFLFAMLSPPEGTDSYGFESFLLSCLFLTGVWLGWMGWYKSVYNKLAGFREGSWVPWFLNFSIHILFVGFMAVGVPTFGMGGLLTMIDTFANNSAGLGILGAIITAAFVFCFLGSLYAMRIVHFM